MVHTKQINNPIMATAVFMKKMLMKILISMMERLTLILMTISPSFRTLRIVPLNPELNLSNQFKLIFNLKTISKICHPSGIELSEVLKEEAQGANNINNIGLTRYIENSTTQELDYI